MTSIHPAEPKGNLGPIELRPEVAGRRDGRHPPPYMSSPDWVVRMVAPIFDRQGLPISPQLGKLQGILESYYRDKPHAFAGVMTLAKLYGCGRRNMQLLIGKGEQAGLWLRIVVGSGRKSLKGFLALKRFDPDRPVIAETPEAIQRGIDGLLDDPDRKASSPPLASRNPLPRKAQSTPRGPAPFDPRKAQSAAPGKAQSAAPELGVLSNQDPDVNVGANVNVASPGGGGAEAPGPVALPQAERPQSPAGPVEPAAEPTTDDQIAQWLVTIKGPCPRWLRDTALRGLDRCGRLPAEWAGKVPAPLPADIAKSETQAPTERRYFAPPTPTPPPPSTIEDMIRRLHQGPPEGALERAKELAARMAEKWDDPGSLHGFVPKLHRAAKGEIQLKSVLNAYRKAMRCGPDAVPGAIFHHWINSYAKS